MMKTKVGDDMEKDIPIIDQVGIEDDGLIKAKDLIQSDLRDKDIDTALILFDPRPSDVFINQSHVLFNFIGASFVLPQYVYKQKIVLAYAPLGGPAAGGLIEELIAYGIRKFIACGSSGMIGQSDGASFLLVEKAIRDEGLSYHYLKPSVYVHTDKALNAHIEKAFIEKNIHYQKGITWTTDAFYKETKARIDKRKSQGALAVEMECASMAAVCKFRGVSFSQVLFFSDIVDQDIWSGFRKDRHQVKEKINQLMIDIAMSVCQKS